MTRMLGIALAILALPLAALGLILAVGAVISLMITLRIGAEYPPAGPFVEVTGGAQVAGVK